jgi:hypothetical protein
MLRRTPIVALLAASTTAALLCAARPSTAVDPEELYQSALADMKARSYASACPKFADARRLKPDSLAALQGGPVTRTRAERVRRRRMAEPCTTGHQNK